jgi:hypothetical protein
MPGNYPGRKVSDMRIYPVLIGVAVIGLAGLFFFVNQGGPDPVTYAPAPPTLLPPEAMGPLAPETTTAGTLPENGVHQWTFDAAAGDSITVQLIATGGTLSILPPDEIFPLAQVSVDDTKDIGEICAQALAEPGTYILQVEGVAAPGTYEVRIDRLGPPTDAPPPVVTETLTTNSSTMTVVRSPPCQPD